MTTDPASLAATASILRRLSGSITAMSESIAAASDADIAAVRDELTDRYGPVPAPAALLFKVAALRASARAMGVTAITYQGQFIRFAPVELPESGQLRLKRLFPRAVLKGAVRTILVPGPTTARIGGEGLRDDALIEWVLGVLHGVIGTSVPAAAALASARTS